MLDVVPFELVVVRLDEIDGRASVADEVSMSDVLLSSEVTCEADNSGATEDDAEEAMEEETGPAEESAALLEDLALDERIAELLDATLLDAGG